MSSKHHRPTRRRVARRKGSWMMAFVILASAVALSTLSVGFGLWLFLWVVESNSPVASPSHVAPKREKVAQRQPVKPPLGKQERTHMMGGVRVDPGQVDPGLRVSGVRARAR